MPGGFQAGQRLGSNEFGPASPIEPEELGGFNIFAWEEGVPEPVISKFPILSSDSVTARRVVPSKSLLPSMKADSSHCPHRFFPPKESCYSR